MGGESVERKISIKSWEHFYSNIDSSKYNSYKILISTESKWIVNFKNQTYPIDKIELTLNVKQIKVVFLTIKI